jgi:hypothetical protein
MRYTFNRRWLTGITAIFMLAGTFALFYARTDITTSTNVSVPEASTSGKTGEKPEILFINETGNRYYDKALKMSVRAAEHRAGIQNAVILLQQLPDNQSAEYLAAEYFKKYRVGERTHGKGLLLLYSEKEKLLKIEVSYALEPIITDVICSRLERGARTFMLTGNRRDFLTELLVTLNLYYYRKTHGESPEEIEFPYEENSFALSNNLSGGAGIVGKGYSQSIEQRTAEVQGFDEEQRLLYAPHADPDVVVQRYLQSLANNIGAIDLPLLTEGSSIYRMEFPRSRGYLQRNHDFYEHAKPYKLYFNGDLAAALFQPDNLVWPILLRKNEKGLWLVDEARAWAYFHMSEGGLNPIQKSIDFPFAFAWQARAFNGEPPPYYPGHRLYTPAVPGYPDNLMSRIHAAEQKIAESPEISQHYFDLADILYFDCYWLTAAIPLYEKGLALEPMRMEYRWRLVDLYLNDTRIDPFLNQLAEIARRNTEDKWAASWYEHANRSFNQ